MIYSPEVPVGATPPADYPPAPSLRKECTAAVAFFTACALAQALRRHTPPSFSDVTGVVILCTTAFAVVSGVFLGRQRWLGSRYASGSLECQKMLALLPVLYLCTVRYTLRDCSLAVFASGMWVGCHVVFLDRVAVLQSFGCKIVRGVAGVREMNWLELTVFVFFSACGAFVATRMGYHLVRNKDSLLRILSIYGTLAVTLCAVKCLPRFRGATFHSHHYFNSLLLLPLTSYPGALPCFLCGLALGSFVEGCACWGVDPIFHHPLSKGVDFGVLFWTSLVPLVTSSSQGARWVELLRNVQPLAEAVESTAASTLVSATASAGATAAPCLARLGKDPALRRAARLSRDLENAESTVPADLDFIRTGPNPATAALIHALDSSKPEERTLILLAFAETVLLGFLLGGRELSAMAAAGGSVLVPLECLAFSDAALSGTRDLQRSYREYRRSHLDERQRDLLVGIKRCIVCALLSMDGSSCETWDEQSQRERERNNETHDTPARSSPIILHPVPPAPSS
jgi:hypothetical protein